MDLQDPTRKMSTTGGSEQGTVYVLDEPKAIEKKLKSAVTDSGSEVRRAPEKPGVSNLIEILAAVRGVDAGGGRGRVRRGALRRLQGRRRRGGRSTTSRPCASATRSCAPTRPRSRRSSRDGAERARAIAADDARATCASAWASARRVGARAGRRRDAAGTVSAMSLAALELDLDVFTGPFDLLLTLVLREEVDLLELQLAEVVLAYLDHLEARGELDLETATEFIVLIAALLELKSRLMLPGEERGAARHRARAGRRGAARADARRAPLPRRRRAPARAARRPSTACASARRRCRRRCAARSSRRPTARRTRRCSARRSAGCC